MNIGEKIRKIRTAEGLSQSDLGDKIGLSADRVQKYENGARTPKEELLDEIAGKLGVNIQALSAPDFSTPESVMHALFDLEESYGLSPEEVNGEIFLRFSDPKIEKYIREWIFQREIREFSLLNAKNDEERARAELYYNLWKWNFPNSMFEKRKMLEEMKQKIEDELKKM